MNMKCDLQPVSSLCKLIFMAYWTQVKPIATCMLANLKKQGMQLKKISSNVVKGLQYEKKHQYGPLS